jgi:threonyl-tRNA synthetase
MAEAVTRLYPGVKLAIGPAIENGFYYDFDLEQPLSQESLAAIEAEMGKIVAEDRPIRRTETPRKEAIDRARAAHQIYKAEMLEEMTDAVVSFYRQDGFEDLCRGPHVPSTGKIGAFKLTSVAGAYWRGSEKNKMLQRIYGIAFNTKKELDEHLRLVEEAKKRDHRKLGRALKLFFFDESSPGCPIWLPNGATIFHTLIDFWRKEHVKAGYTEIRTPLLFNKTCWERSGHWDHYKEYMFLVPVDEETFALKPMDCVDAIMCYMLERRSYRELPLRLNEIGMIHRNEKAGTLSGLFRVRQITQDDAHIFVTREQIEDEITQVIHLVDRFYKIFGFEYTIRLSTRPPDGMGEKALWDEAERALENAIKANKLQYSLAAGEGAFYGPKIDFDLKDSLQRTWQCATIQLDFQLPERFQLAYVGEDGKDHRPVMIHRVIFGALERFMGILIEHYAGSFPVWLAPVQARVISITDAHVAYAKKVLDQLNEREIRAEADLRNETTNLKIREATLEKIPYILVVGDKEVRSNAVSVRSRKKGDEGACKVEKFVQRILAEIGEKK